MPTIYISNLNAEQTLGIVGEFAGGLTAQDAVNGSLISGGYVNFSDIKDTFKFYTTPDTGNEDTNTSLTGNFTALSKTAGDIFTHGPLTTAKNEMLGFLSEAIFGSSEAVDLFSNSNSVRTNFSNKIDDCDFTAGNITDAGATKELVNGLLTTATPRFSLEYNAVVDETFDLYNLNYDGTNSSALSLTNVNVLSNSVATSTKVSIEIDASNNITNITITEVGSGTEFINTDQISFDTTPIIYITAGEQTSTQVDLLNGITSVTASSTNYNLIVKKGENAEDTVEDAEVEIEFASDKSILRITSTTDATEPVVAGDKITFVDGASYGTDVVIPSINSVQAAMLNGSLDFISGTAAPIEVDDVIRVKYTINSNPDQKNASNILVSAVYQAYVDFTVQTA